MLIIDSSLFFTILFLAIPVLAIRDIIRALRKFKQKRDNERLDRLIQESDASMARAEKVYQEFMQWEEENKRRREEYSQRIRELEAAVEAASDPDERSAALNRLITERAELLKHW